MTWKCLALAAALVLTLGAHASPEAAPASNQAQPGPAIHIEDVYLFYKVYDAADRQPSADRIQRDYLDLGSEGLHRFVEERHTTAASIAGAITAHPDVYSDARRCMAVLPQVRHRLDASLDKLTQLYPVAALAPVTIAVGRGKPVGISDATGVMIGLEALCAIGYLEPNVEDRFVHVLAHEYAHVQQARSSPAMYDDPKPTVLEESLIEGAAEFVGEQISGSVSDVYLPAMTKGREKDIETDFVADEDKTDLSKWLYNGTLTKPGDIGYWVGYRIVKSYYQHAGDKRQAMRDILEMKDPKAFLARSGWQPGIQLD
ncbi:MAG: lytic murein transglycosylase [Dyella sp.]|nr:lytic murein transglycosylase [Dyella sp.]